MSFKIQVEIIQVHGRNFHQQLLTSNTSVFLVQKFLVMQVSEDCKSILRKFNHAYSIAIHSPRFPLLVNIGKMMQDLLA